MTQVLPLVSPRGWRALPPWAWIALHAAALWPHGLWALERARDGSDDPLGAVAAAALALMLVRLAPVLRAEPHAAWLALAAALGLAATVARVDAPPLVAAALAAASLGAGIAAWLPARAPRLALAMLALLALPLIASLQFYAGYPLRVLTAEASTWLLRAGGLDALRSGASMTVGGRLVIVDAPCSGVQLAWLGYFCAAAVAAWTGLGDRALLRRLPLASALVLAGNVLRNSVLVAWEARPHGASTAVHEAVGLVATALTAAAIVAVMSRSDDDARDGR